MLENSTIDLDEEETSLPLSIHKVFFFFGLFVKIKTPGIFC